MSTGPRIFRQRHAWTALAVTIIVSVAFLYGRFSYTSVCTQCGALQLATDWQVPATSITLFRKTRIETTPVREAMLRSGVPAGHAHQWLFCQGSGNGITCALGRGQNVGMAVRSETVVALLDQCDHFGETEFRARLVRKMFDPQTASSVVNLSLQIPPDGFSDAPAFHAWLESERFLIDDLFDVQPAIVSAELEERPSLPDWGPAVEEIQCRARLERSVIKRGDPIELLVDLRHRGTRDIHMISIHYVDAELQVDNEKIEVPSLGLYLGGPIKPFKPGQQFVDARISTGGHQGETHRRDPTAQLAPGKHRLCLRLFLPGDEKGPPNMVAGQPMTPHIVVESQPMTLEIVGPVPSTADPSLPTLP